jgi:sulfite reductase alpha subunit-like flavoprotein
MSIAFVYGSFHKKNCIRDVKIVHELLPKDLGLPAMAPVEGNAFDFNSLKDMKVLVICTSSKLGFPPPNMLSFAHHLLTAARTNPGCLSHLRHVVCGSGQEMYKKTYMNMPRYIDQLLEACGSRRFYQRGEFGEPHAALNTDKCDPKDWSKGMWQALADTLAADGQGTTWTATPWDALWEKKASPVHNSVTQWDSKQLGEQIKKAKMKPPKPSVFAKL